MMKLEKTRKCVLGKYINSSTYVLFNPDNTEFLKIKEGVPFKIGKLIFIPKKVKEKNSNKTFLVCEKFNNNSVLIDKFSLHHNKWLLWATTDKAARKGVFYYINIPKTPLEKYLLENGYPTNIITRKENIDNELLYDESRLLASNTSFFKKGYDCFTDGDIMKCSCNEDDTDAKFSIFVSDATFIIYYKILVFGNSRKCKILNIYLSPEANEDYILKEFKKLLKK